jgi:hypothetical protein
MNNQEQQPIIITGRSERTTISRPTMPKLNYHERRILLSNKSNFLERMHHPVFQGARAMPFNLERLLVAAHLRRTYFRNIDFDVCFNYNNFISTETTETVYSFYDLNFGIRGLQGTKFENSGTTIDTQIKQMLKFGLNSPNIAANCRKYEAPFDATVIQFIELFNNPPGEGENIDKVRLVNNVSENEWMSILIAREFVFCFRKVQIALNIGLVTYKTKMVGGKKNLIAHYVPWENTEDPTEEIDVLYPRMNGTPKIENDTVKIRISSFQQEFFLNISYAVPQIFSIFQINLFLGVIRTTLIFSWMYLFYISRWNYFYCLCAFLYARKCKKDINVRLAAYFLVLVWFPINSIRG